MKTLWPLLRARWEALPRREQRLVMAAAAVLLLAALWWIALAPALLTLRHADVQHRQLDAQLQQMLQLQAQARTMQAQPRLSFDEARRLLEASVQQQLGSTAALTVAGERVTVSFKGASADALAQWLAQARFNARAVPTDARLVRSSTGAWDGTLVLNVGTR